MYFFLKYIVTLFYKKLRIKIVVYLLRESGPRIAISFVINTCTFLKMISFNATFDIYSMHIITRDLCRNTQ